MVKQTLPRQYCMLFVTMLLASLSETFTTLNLSKVSSADREMRKKMWMSSFAWQRQDSNSKPIQLQLLLCKAIRHVIFASAVGQLTLPSTQNSPEIKRILYLVQLAKISTPLLQ